MWKSAKKNKPDFDKIRKSGKRIVFWHGEGDSLYKILPPKKEYLAAHKAVSADLKAGHIRAFATGYNAARGRYIEVQTDQGWNPDPFWQEFIPYPHDDY